MPYDSKILLSLIKQFWLQSDNGKFPIKNMTYQLMEVGKWHSKTRIEIWDYLQLLIDTGHIESLSEDQLLYQFTERGKTIKTIEDIESIATNGG